MADELTISSGISGAKGYLDIYEEPGSQSIDMDGTRDSSGVQDVGFAAHELLTSDADFGTAGWAWFRNLDDTNFVELGLDVAAAFVPFAKLLPGEHFVVPLATKSIYAKSDTAAVKVRKHFIER